MLSITVVKEITSEISTVSQSTCKAKSSDREYPNILKLNYTYFYSTI